MDRWTRSRGAALAGLVAGLALVATGCASSDPAGAAGAPPAAAGPTSAPTGSPAQSPVASPAESPAAPAPAPATQEPRPEQASDDGTWHARIVRAQEETLVLDKVEILSGTQADEARAEDGQPDPTQLPYVRNRNAQLRTLPVAGDVDLQVISCPQDGCALAAWPYEDLVAGTPLPYGTPAIPFSVTVVDGTVVALSEVYFP